MNTPRVVIVGGGFAGLETAFSLRERLGDRIDLTLVADRPDFVFTPGTIYVPFGGAEDDLRLPVGPPATRRGIAVRRGAVAWVETDPKRIALADGHLIDYDYLVLATGARPRPEEVPGLAEHAHLIGSLDRMRELGRGLKRVRDAAVDGSPQHVLFLVPPGNLCAGPLYELAFMLEKWLRRARVRDRICVTFATHEGTYLQAFGTGLDRVVDGEFADRGVVGCRSAAVERVEPGLVRFADGTARVFDLLVAAAPHGPAVDYEGLPQDRRGFVLTDAETRRVRRTDAVYAPGDAGDFPLKLGFLSMLQADAVADDIAHRIDPAAVERPRRFDPVGLCVMEMSDDAMFTHVPLTLTGDPVPVGGDDDHLIGVSPIWRLGRRALGVYLPRQFRAGRPFHGGLPGGPAGLGYKGLSRVLAGTVKE
ncbi:NAD(P)/FAD-dependent oxidoreductase [Glycomyces sp. NRRL B-16210]|uniref:NAD(P)/FAD-dependent oxidoreductase n=1 Tax=Glycomyces sp. NRRL B-16210 TaxID=1463821 RepID=UPI0004BEB0FA|nr:FAD-dependent oxidoreductase [Glycomyces sp. NRRL B-16210]